MKPLTFLAMVAVAMVLTGCGDAGKGKNPIGDLTPEKMKAKAAELLGSLTSGLEDIKDKATAETAVSKLSPMIDQLSKLKTAMKDKLPSLDSLKTAAADLATKFKDKTDILGVLQPLLDKIKSLTG